jgi:hypothetical protein
LRRKAFQREGGLSPKTSYARNFKELITHTPTAEVAGGALYRIQLEASDHFIKGFFIVSRVLLPILLPHLTSNLCQESSSLNQGNQHNPTALKLTAP